MLKTKNLFRVNKKADRRQKPTRSAPEHMSPPPDYIPMKFDTLTGIVLGIASLVLHVSAQGPVCVGENTGIDKPNWHIEYAYDLQKAMCAAPCEEEPLRQDDEPYCTKSLILDETVSLELDAYVAFIGEVFCNDTTVGDNRCIVA
jgi:hypothetical protein